MPGLMSDLGSEQAERVAEKLRQSDPSSIPVEEVQNAIRAAWTLANLTLFAWEAVQQRVAVGVEGGEARALTAKAAATIEVWLDRLRVAIRIEQSWNAEKRLPSRLQALLDLESRLQRALLGSRQLVELVNGPPPALPEGVLERIEAAGQADDTTEYLDAKEFLARTRARKGP